MDLYEVEIQAIAYVWATSQREAEQIAQDEIDEVMEGADYNAVEHGAKSPIWSDWRGSEPFGDAPEGFDGLTVSEIHEKWEGDDPQPESDPFTLPLPFN